MADRVAVFIDAQNVYRSARDAFFRGSDPHWRGQFDPRGLARLLCARGPAGVERELAQVRVYTGRPDASKQPKTYGAHRRQCAAWQRSGVAVIHRPLRYPRNWPRERPQEKGIDVLLALHFVTQALDGAFDVGIIASTDTDLAPALEYVSERCAPRVRSEVTAWRSPRRKSRLHVPGRRIWCHFLDEADYGRVADRTNYAT